VQFENVVQSSLTAVQTDFAKHSADVIQTASAAQAPGYDPAEIRKDDYLEAAHNVMDRTGAGPGEEQGILSEAAAAHESETGLDVWAALV
jgi:hypothetical protein